MANIRRDGWTEKEKSYLIRHYQELSDEEIAKKLGRSTYAVRRKRMVLRFLRVRRKVVSKRSKLTKDERVHVLMSAMKLVDQCKSATASCKCKYCKRAREIMSIFNNPTQTHILYEIIKPELELLP